MRERLKTIRSKCLKRVWSTICGCGYLEASDFAWRAEEKKSGIHTGEAYCSKHDTNDTFALTASSGLLYIIGNNIISNYNYIHTFSSSLPSVVLSSAARQPLRLKRQLVVMTIL